MPNKITVDNELLEKLKGLDEGSNLNLFHSPFSSLVIRAKQKNKHIDLYCTQNAQFTYALYPIYRVFLNKNGYTIKKRVPVFQLGFLCVSGIFGFVLGSLGSLGLKSIYISILFVGIFFSYFMILALISKEKIEKKLKQYGLCLNQSDN